MILRQLQQRRRCAARRSASRQRLPHLGQLQREQVERDQLLVNALVEATPISGPACV